MLRSEPRPQPTRTGAFRPIAWAKPRRGAGSPCPATACPGLGVANRAGGGRITVTTSRRGGDDATLELSDRFRRALDRHSARLAGGLAVPDPAQDRRRWAADGHISGVVAGAV